MFANVHVKESSAEETLRFRLLTILQETSLSSKNKKKGHYVKQKDGRIIIKYRRLERHGSGKNLNISIMLDTVAKMINARGVRRYMLLRSEMSEHFQNTVLQMISRKRRDREYKYDKMLTTDKSR